MVLPRVQSDDFDALVAAVHACGRCPRMEGRTRVLGHGNGPLCARILFVAEAPGRLGADHCGIPLSGDRTGRTFDALLREGAIPREAVFITNAVLCNPRDAEGRNAPPSAAEMANCRAHLDILIRILDPRWVVSLGAVALRALANIAPHAATLRRDVGEPMAWHSRRLVPLYHPGPRALIHRPFAVQCADYRRLATLTKSASEREATTM